MTLRFWKSHRRLSDPFADLPARLALIGLVALWAPIVQAATLHVDVIAGADGAGCGPAGSPCASIQQAVNLASSGDTILVAEGVYVDDVSCLGAATVVCVMQKDLTILGGFAGGGWSLPDPATNVTVIDGQDTRRGVVVQGFGTTTLRMEGFTVRNGRATGSPHGFGGGLNAALAHLTLRDMVFRDNLILGGTDGLAGGGGAAALSDANNVMDVVLERVAFRFNEATGGGGSTGGASQGGGFMAGYATVDMLSVVFEDNTSTGGGSASHGKDGLGGALAFSFGSDVTIRDLTATGNLAIGGAGTTDAGGGFGGAVFTEGRATPAADATVIRILDSHLSGNTARGGDGGSAGGGVGGGIMSFGSQATIERTVIVGNLAEGGTGSSTQGNAGGGGIFLEWPFGSPTPLNVVRNSIVADNVINGSQGGGGGIRLLAARADVEHTTLVDNRRLGPGFGLGILAGPRLSQPSALTLRYSILADHAVPSNGRALYVQQTASASSSADLSDPSHFVGNANDTNQGRPGSGTFVGFPGSNVLDPDPSTFFIDPTVSDYHVDGTQPPSQAAGGSSEAADVDGASRSGTRDMGADEFGVHAFPLTVGKVGVGDGTVTSSPAGISCGTDCFENVAEDAVVALTATPGSGFWFVGWGGDADCADGNLTMTGERQCIARFQDSVPTSIVVEKQTVPNGRAESFEFSGDVAGSIGDDEQLVRNNLAPGTYTVTEADHVLFDLTGISCDDGNSSGDVGSATATFVVEAGETVTCVFTNTLTNCSSTNDLVLSGDTVHNTRTETACNSITAGPYTISSSGDVTFESPTVILRDGFVVQGRFRVINDTPP